MPETIVHAVPEAAWPSHCQVQIYKYPFGWMLIFQELAIVTAMVLTRGAFRSCLSSLSGFYGNDYLPGQSARLP